MQYAKKYMEEMNAILRRIEETQLPNIQKAAETIADSVAKGGVLHYASFMHAPGEPISRAGGLFLINPIRLNFGVERPTPYPHPKLGRTSPRHLPLTPELEDYFAEACDFVPGDVLLISNNAGQGPHVVGLALAARRKGLPVIAITSSAYGAYVRPYHPTGKRLFEAADLVLDTCAVIGDALVEIPGLDIKACPGSGVAEIYVVWALIAQVIYELAQRGVKPHVMMSVNLDEAPEYNRRAAAEFKQTGV